MHTRFRAGLRQIFIKYVELKEVFRIDINGNVISIKAVNLSRDEAQTRDTHT